MTGNLWLDIIIVVAVLLAVIAALRFGGVFSFSAFGASVSAGKNGPQRKTELLKEGRVEGGIGKVIGRDQSGGGGAAPGDLSIGEKMVVSRDGRIDEIVGERISGGGKDGRQ